MSKDADIQTVREYVSRLDEDMELIEEDEIRQTIKKYCTKPVREEEGATIAAMLSELCTLSLQRRCERTAKYLKEFHKPEEKPEALFQLTLDGVCTKLNAHSDPGVLYCIDDMAGDPVSPSILKVVRGRERGGLWYVRAILTERKARGELEARSRVVM